MNAAVTVLVAVVLAAVWLALVLALGFLWTGGRPRDTPAAARVLAHRVRYARTPLAQQPTLPLPLPRSADR